MAQAAAEVGVAAPKALLDLRCEELVLWMMMLG